MALLADEPPSASKVRFDQTREEGRMLLFQIVARVRYDLELRIGQSLAQKFANRGRSDRVVLAQNEQGRRVDLA